MLNPFQENTFFGLQFSLAKPAQLKTQTVLTQQLCSGPLLIRNQWTHLGPQNNMAILSRMAMVALLVSASHASITSYHVSPLVAKAKSVGSLSERATQKTNALGQHKTTGVMELEKTAMTLRGGGESISCVFVLTNVRFHSHFWGPQTTCDSASSAFINA